MTDIQRLPETLIRMGLLRKKPSVTQEFFDDHWANQHASLVRSLPDIQEYWQNVVIDKLQRGITYSRGAWDFDGVSALRFGQDAKSNSAGADLSAVMPGLLADERKFIGELHIVTAKQTAVMPPPQERDRLLKRISTLQRRPEITEDDFLYEWRVHRELVSHMPRVMGYRQNVIMSRQRIRGQACEYNELPIDGLVELWFEDADSLEAAFGSPEGQKTMAHASTFISEITAFQVRERRMI